MRILRQDYGVIRILVVNLFYVLIMIRITAERSTWNTSAICPKASVSSFPSQYSVPHVPRGTLKTISVSVCPERDGWFLASVPRGTFPDAPKYGIEFTGWFELFWRADSPTKKYGTRHRGCQPEGWRREDHDCHQPCCFSRCRGGQHAAGGLRSAVECHQRIRAAERSGSHQHLRRHHGRGVGRRGVAAH